MQPARWGPNKDVTPTIPEVFKNDRLDKESFFFPITRPPFVESLNVSVLNAFCLFSIFLKGLDHQFGDVDPDRTDF
jgi:hypothetical protein